MSIQITGIPPVINDSPEPGKSKNAGGAVGQSQGTGKDEVSISDTAGFIVNIKNLINSSSASPETKLEGIKQKVQAGTYSDSSKIAEGILKNISITNE